MDNVIDAYKRIQTNVQMEYRLGRVTYDSPVNFNESLQKPRHRWFPYKEGFSPSFVRSFLNRYVNETAVRALDPFAGVGTTIIEATSMGHAGLGIEINPLAFFISETKKIDLNSSQLEEFKMLVQQFLLSPLTDVAPPPGNDTVKSYFQAPELEALLKVKAFICALPPGPIQNLFKTAFLSIIEIFSTHRKAGNGLKRKTRQNHLALLGETAVDRVRKYLHHYLKIYQEDLSAGFKSSNATFILGSSLEISNLKTASTFNTVLTSPPYANCFDYSKIYLCELWMGDFFTDAESQKNFRMESIRSHVHAKWPSRYEDKGSELMNSLIYPRLREKELWSRSIPNMLRGYFMDIGQLLSSLSSLVEPDSPVGIVVGNSVYGGIPIATDLLISEIAERYGFRTECIEVYRHIVPSSQQYVQMDDKEFLRESMVVLRKS